MEEGLDYGLIYLFVIASLSIMVIVGGFFGLVILYQKRQMKNINEKRSLEAKHQKGLLKAFIETQEKERKRIAADLHDEIGASLAATKMHLSQLQTKDEHEETKLQDGIQLILQTAENARRISHNLMPPALETLGLNKTLARFMEASLGTEISCEFHYDGNIKLSPEEELSYFRISQELLNNTLKHAKASQIHLTVKQAEAEIHYSYFDNGIGFKKDQNIGLGLQNIESRVQSIGAELIVHADPGKCGVHIIQIKK